MADWSSAVSAGSALGALVCSGAVTFLTHKITHATVDMRDAAQAQARSAQASTLVQLGPIIGARIDRFIQDHRAALEGVERLFVDRPDLVSALIKAECGVDTVLADFETVRLHSIDVSEIIPDSVDGTTLGPKVFSVGLSVKPLSPELQRLLQKRDGYNQTDLSIPRWGTSSAFIIDEDICRSVYRALWPAIHDANDIQGEAFHYMADELLIKQISRDWRASLVFELAKTGYKSPTQYRRYKLDGKTVIVRNDDDRFVALQINDAASLKQLDYEKPSPLM